MITSLSIRNVSGDFGSYYPTDTNDDGFITQIGNHFVDTPYLPLRSATTDVIDGLRFRDLDIPQDAKINNATLFVRTLHTYDPGVVLVTIYGVDENDAYAFNSSGDFTRIYTSNHVVWNVTDVNGYSWHNVSVTNIVQEIISRYGWRPGNSLAFIILADSGEPRREFASIDNYVAWTPRLDIYFDETPTAPSDEAEAPYNDTALWDWEYENTTGGIDIWKVTSYGFPSFQAFSLTWGVNNPYYINSTNVWGSEVQWGTTNFAYSQSGALNPILALDPWTFIFADNGSASVYYSDDEFATISVEDPNDQYGTLAAFSGNIGSMALDRLDNETIHLVWPSPMTAHPGWHNIIYTNFTFDVATETIVWATTYTSLTHEAYNLLYPVIYCQNNGSLHVVYGGEQGTNDDQIWYRRRHTNGTWLDQVRVSEADVLGNPHGKPDVIVNEETGDALVVWDYDASSVYWDIVFPNNTDGTDRVASTGLVPAMVNDRENNIAQLVYQTTGGNPQIRHRTKTITDASAWSGAMQVSPVGEKHYYPDIGIDPINGSLQAIWYNDWNQWTAGNYWRLGVTSAAAKTRITAARMQNNWIEKEFTRTGVFSFYFIAYPNGTLISDEPFDTLEDAIDAIEDLIGVDPEDPETDKYGEALTKNRWKTFVFVIGMVMFLGTPTFALMSRVSIGRWIMVLFISLCGLTILWSIVYM